MSAGSVGQDGDSRDRFGGSRPAPVERMLALGRLRERTFTPEEVAAVWRKAVESARDAEVEGLSLDGALRLAYDAGHLAAAALLAAHGLRTGSGPGHHEAAFSAASALGESRLPGLVPDSEEIRLLRAGSMYDPSLADDSDLARTLGWMRQTLPALRAALLDASPALEPLLESYP